MKEFNLSKKSYNWNEGDVIPKSDIYYKEEDVKEFIKILKDFLVIHWTEQDAHFFEEELNKRAGKELTKEDEK